jgi:uncharacterized protein (TIGR03032 family)
MAEPADRQLELTASRQFTPWLAEQRVSLAFTTYQAGKLFLIGLQPDGRLSVFERSFARAMGLHAAGNSLFLSSLYQFWRFEDILGPGEDYQGHDRLYVPQVAYTTGDLDIHDIAVRDPTGQDPAALAEPVFVNTLFSCLATVSPTHSFRPLWKPPFISKLAAEDRCHLNGLAMDGAEPAIVTAVSASDAAEGWREHRHDGGIVMDVRTQETLAVGLSMPHSPRLHQGRLWLIQAGTGEFGYLDRDTGRFEPVAFCPGYLRGAAMIGDYAVVGTSKLRDNRTFTGLALDDRLAEKQVSPRCGLAVIDLKRGDVVHQLRIDGVVEELYDVTALPGVNRPAALGMRTDEIRRVLSIEPTPGLT